MRQYQYRDGAMPASRPTASAVAAAPIVKGRGTRRVRNFAAAAACALAFLSAGSAFAVTITFDPLDARWENAVPEGANSNVMYNPSATPTTGPTDFSNDTVTVSWGQTTGTQSSYQYDSRNVPFSESENTPFMLGAFTHNNFVITTGTSITGVDLRLRGTIAANGDTFTDREFVFNFMHNETPNGTPANGGACPNGGTNGEGANVNGCADIVTFGAAPGNDVLTLADGTQITLQLLGFLLPGQTPGTDTPLSEFDTVENAVNTANLWAQFTVVTPAVPEPTTLALFGFGLLGLGAVRRRRSR